MDRILFIVPPYISYDYFINPGFNEREVVKESGTYASLVTDMPLGVLSLSAYVKKYSDAETKLIDFNIILNKADSFYYSSFSELFRDVLSQQDYIDFNPTIIGISTLFSSAYYNMIDIAAEARKVYPDALIYSGGGIPTNIYKEIFRDSKDFDMLSFGEGERPLLELVKAKDKQKLLDHHDSWITREKVRAGMTFVHDDIIDLDEIPFYDYDILNISDYGLSPTVKTYSSFGDQDITFHIATSRGCIHRCCFCASHSVHGRKMRYHSIRRVREDLEQLQLRFGATKIGIQDDHFMADKDRANQIINILKEMNMTIFFQSGLALYALDRPMLEAMKEAGVKQLVLAVESGSNRVLKEIMHKPINLDIIRRVVDDCRDLGIETDANIVVGVPGETKQDMEDSLAYLQTLNAGWFRIYIATPLVGSEMFDICRQNNYISGSYLGGDFKHSVIETEDFTADYIREKVYEMNLSLNFVHNSDFRLGNYDVALKGFLNTINVKHDHAIAYYFAARCYEKLNDAENYQKCKATSETIIAESEFWRGYVEHFNLTPLT